MRISDWSSDVCSSDLRASGLLEGRVARVPEGRRRGPADLHPGLAGGEPGADRKSVVSGTSVSVRVDLGGRRIIKTKKHHQITHTNITQRIIITEHTNLSPPPIATTYNSNTHRP